MTLEEQIEQLRERLARNGHSLDRIEQRITALRAQLDNITDGTDQ